MTTTDQANKILRNYLYIYMYIYINEVCPQKIDDGQVENLWVASHPSLQLLRRKNRIFFGKEERI